ncbi:SPOSA6832_04103 [Sporobolomyces salmonicolor]|uniref:SPOSA6832_04103-mRNA-1:cds n=1 Tax=Sporidiobolus salmonicolor TaxID=5005 RepID=A0A0D6ER27_SPOSA|nr:SPOSA6832_04103 [Sporobolomyces salmonicolor]
MPSDSEGSEYTPDVGDAINSGASSRHLPSRASRAPSSSFTTSAPADLHDYSRAASTDPGTAAITTDLATPAGSEQADEDDIGSASGAATPQPVEEEQPAAPVKRSKALNFLKKKETKTIKGTTYKIQDDEIVLEDDPRGEAKIDSDGNLLGGRTWKVHTFTSPLRQNPNKLYMLSIDAARCAGFRDSLYFFRRNPLIHKLSCSQPEKDRLIELGRLSGNLKSRAVTMVSARNVFKVMGATFLADGKYVFDDYCERPFPRFSDLLCKLNHLSSKDEDKALAAGHKPGEPAFIEPYDPDKDTGTLAVSKGNAPPGATSLGLNVLIGHPGKPKVPGAELITSQIGGGMHATFGGTGLQPFGRSWDPAAKKAKPASHLDWENWMYEYAKEVRDKNRELIGVRRSHIGQVAVGLDVAEREEDCWEELEEEYTDDEEQQPAVGTSMHRDVMPPPPPPPAFDPSAIPPAIPHVSTPAPYDPSALSALPTKKRLIRVYNPIRGVYDPETNVPHVYRSTQPTTAEVARVDAAAHVLEHVDEADWVGVDPRKRRRVELEAAKMGAASLEYVCVDEAWSTESRRGREPLSPGMWDFGAGPGVVA